jgi:hypothetical protein
MNFKTKNTTHWSMLFLLIIFIAQFNSCTHNIYLKNSDASQDHEMLKELNRKGKLLSSTIYLKNGENYKVENLRLSNDTLSFVILPINSTDTESQYKMLSTYDVEKIKFNKVLKGGVDGLCVGLGLGLASGFLAGYIQPLDSEDPPPREVVIFFDSILGGISGAIIGIPIGMFVKKHEVYHFENFNR